jgi:hypothetical protein
MTEREQGVAAIYRRVLLREPDEGGLAHYAASTWSLDYIEQIIQRSPEAQQLASGAIRSRDHVYDGIWQGRYPHDNVAGEGFSLLVLCAHERQDPPSYQIEVIKAPMNDTTQSPNIEERERGMAVPLAQQVVEAARRGRKVLVTCVAGHNRSGLVTGLALRMMGLPGPDAVNLIRQKRYGSLFNVGFVRFIEEYTP